MRGKIVFVAAALAAAVLMGASGGARAASIRTIDFSATDLVTSGDPFGLLGIAAPTSVTGSLNFDTGAAALSGPTTTNPGTSSEMTRAYRPYLSFTVHVGAVTLIGSPFPSLDDSMLIQDGTGSSEFHIFQANSSAVQALGPDLFQTRLLVSVWSTLTENPFDGTDVPSIDALNSMNFTQSVRFDLADSSGNVGIARWRDVTFSAPSAVPLPSSMPLFDSGLVVLGLLGWHRRRKVVDA